MQIKLDGSFRALPKFRLTYRAAPFTRSPLSAPRLLPSSPLASLTWPWLKVADAFNQNRRAQTAAAAAPHTVNNNRKKLHT